MDNTISSIEVWKDIPEFNGVYQASNFGRIKSFKAKDPNGRILKYAYDKGGYTHLVLVKNKKPLTRKVHHLVMSAFVGDRGSLVVDHIDSVRDNNNLDNLRYITQRENIARGKLCKNCVSVFVGVQKNKGSKKWMARISIRGKEVRLGTFVSELDARDAYLAAIPF